MATIHGSRELSLGGRERPRSRQKVADDEDYEPPEAVRHFPVVLARGHWEVVSGLAHDKRRVDGNLCALRGRRALPGGRASHPGGGQANNKKPPSVWRTVY